MKDVVMKDVVMKDVVMKDVVMNQLDHIVVAAPDLDAAKRSFERRTGVAPVNGGSHVGLGTRNALVSFGGGRYLEIIAPDPEQKLDGTYGGMLAKLPEERLMQWALRVSGLKAVSTRAVAAGFEPGEIRRMSRAQPNGNLLVWELMVIRGHQWGSFVPFYIDWLDCPHPSQTSPVVGTLTAFQLTLPAARQVEKLVDAAEGVTITTGPQRLRAVFESPKGTVVYEAETLPVFM